MGAHSSCIFAYLRRASDDRTSQVEERERRKGEALATFSGINPSRLELLYVGREYGLKSFLTYAERREVEREKERKK